MHEIKEGVLTICVVLIGTQVMVRLCPKNSMVHFVRALITVVLLLSVIASALKMEWKFSPQGGSQGENEVLTQYVEEQYLEAARQDMVTYIQGLLAVVQIKPTKIYVETDINETSGIECTKVIATFAYSEDAQRAKTLLEEALGENTEVEVSVNE